MPNKDDHFRSHLLDAIRVVRMRQLLTTVLPFTPTVLAVNCHDQLVRWIAERVGWVVAVDSDIGRLERCKDYDNVLHGWSPDNLDLFHGALAEYIESPEAWDWRIGFDLIIEDGTLATAEDPGQELVRMRSWAPWILAAGGDGMGGDDFIGLFEKIIVCDADEDAMIILGK